MAQHQQRPKLEVSTAVPGVGQQARASRQPLPQGLGGQAWRGAEPQVEGPRIAFIVTTSDSLQQIRVWISYHRAIGVTTFYIFADGQVGGGVVGAWCCG